MNRGEIVNFMKSFERPHETFELTVTFGHFLVHQDNLSAVEYDEEYGVLNFLDYLERLGWEKIIEDNICIGAANGKESVILGLGCQINWEYKNFISMVEVDKAYLNFVEGLFDELKRRKQLLIASGHQPTTKVEDIKPLLTERSKALLQYAETQKGLKEYLLSSASMNVSLQYAHSDNFQKRFQAAMVIQPALAAFFDNASWVNGQENREVMVNLNNLHQSNPKLYEIAIGLESTFKYQEYAHFLAKIPAIAVPTESGFDYVGEISNDEAYGERHLSESEIKQIFSSAQSSVAITENGLTIRNIDSVPYPLNMAYVLMIKAILYNSDHITALEKMLDDMQEDQLVSSGNSLYKKGLQARLGDGIVKDLVKDLFFMISLSVEPSEQHYLQPLNSLIFKDIEVKAVGAKHFSAIVGN